MKVPHLMDVASKFHEEVRDIECVFNHCVNHPLARGFSSVYSPSRDGCVISLWDSWNRFIRDLLLTSCSGVTIGGSGKRYTPTQAFNESEAVSNLLALANVKGSGVKATAGEPHWFDYPNLQNYCSALGLSNSNTILPAVQTSTVYGLVGGQVSNPLSSLRVIRNYMAHKNTGTRSRLNDLLLGRQANSVDQYLLAQSAGGIALFSEWVEGLTAIADAATW